MKGLPTWPQFSGYGADVMESAPVRQALKQNFGSPGRISKPPQERRPPVRQHCPLLRRNRRVGDRRSARGCPRWWQCQEALHTSLTTANRNRNAAPPGGILCRPGTSLRTRHRPVKATTEVGALRVHELPETV